MTSRSTEVTRWVLRGDTGTAEKYKPRGRVLLARAIAKRNSDARKIGVEREELENGTVAIVARSDFAGNTVIINAGPANDCCTYDPSLPLDPYDEEGDGDEEDDSVDEAFGGGEWNGKSCGDLLGDNDEGYYNSGGPGSLHFNTSAKDGWGRNPCPQGQYPGDSGYSTGVVVLTYCSYVEQDYDLDESFEEAGNSGQTLLGVCADGQPIYLDWSVEVYKKHYFYDWNQIYYHHSMISNGSVYATHNVGACLDNMFGYRGKTSFNDREYAAYRRWWVSVRRWDFRRARLTINIVSGAGSVPLVDISVFREKWDEAVETHYKELGKSVAEYNCCGGSHQCPVSSKITFSIPGGTWKNGFNKSKDVMSYIPDTLKEVASCEDVGAESAGEGEGEDEEQGNQTTVQQRDPASGCVRCVRYRGDTVECYGPWLDPDTGQPCTNPPADDSAVEESPEEETEEEEEPGLKDNFPTDEETGERLDTPDEPTDEDDDGESIVNKGPGEFVNDDGWIDDGATWTMPGTQDDIDKYNNSSAYKDYEENLVEGPPQGVYKDWVKELLTRPVSDFETWVPPNLVSIATGGKTCRNS